MPEDGFLHLIRPKMSVLDLGAGDGRQSEKFLREGAEVFAVDKILPKNPNPYINWIIDDARNYIQSTGEKFDVIYSRNLIQLFDKEYVLNVFLPLLWERLLANGHLIIYTFYKMPIPPFQKNFSLFTREELLEHLVFNGKCIFADQFEQEGPDLEGKRRKFYITAIHFQKSPES